MLSGNSAAAFSVQVDGGAGNAQAVGWLSVTPAGGTTPTYLTVSAAPGALSAGARSARVRIIPKDPAQSPIDVAVTLSITLAAPRLSTAPLLLRFGARVRNPGTLEQAIVLRNAGGGGSIGYTTSVLGRSPWIADLTPPAGQTVPNQQVIVRVRVNTQGLTVGSYRDVVRIVGAGEAIEVPVILFVAAQGALLGVDAPALWQHGAALSSTVHVLNLGDPGTTVDWTAELVSGSDWLSLGANSGVATRGMPAELRLTPLAAAASFPFGARYALIKISDQRALNSPQYVTNVLEVPKPGSAPVPDLTPVGLIFAGAERGAQPASQTVSFYAGTTDTAPFHVAVTTRDGGNWLSVSPDTGTVTFFKPVPVQVSVNTLGLKAGVYTADVNFAIGAELRTVSVTLIVRPAQALNQSASNPRAADACTPAQMFMTSTFTPNNFSVHISWPVVLTVQVSNDCGSASLDASVVSSFTNGDPPMSLSSDGAGSYSATWVPGRPLENINVSFIATHPGLQSAAAAADLKLHGGVNPNPQTARVLFPFGTVSNVNPVLGAPLAPGSVASVYGINLADFTGAPASVPLPTQFKGTEVLVGGLTAPLFYVSPSQVNIQIPTELVPNRQYSVVATVNGVVTVPDLITVVSAQPGIAALPDGQAIAQHGDGKLVSASSPARAGEALTVYLVGMGATNPAVNSGSAAPASPLAQATIKALVTLDGVPVETSYAGLTP